MDTPEYENAWAARKIAAQEYVHYKHTTTIPDEITQDYAVISKIYNLSNNVKVLVKSKEASHIFLIQYYKNDVIHRDGDKPAKITYNYGECKTVEYYNNGKIYSKLEFMDNYVRTYSESFYKNGELYKMIHHSRNLRTKYYYKNEKMHRDDDKPAIIKYYPNGKIEEEMYLKNDKFHRDNDKPARIKYYKNGYVRKEQYFIKGSNKRNDPTLPIKSEYLEKDAKGQLYGNQQWVIDTVINAEGKEEVKPPKDLYALFTKPYD